MMRYLSLPLIVFGCLVLFKATAMDECDAPIDPNSIETCSAGAIIYHDSTLTIRGHLKPNIYRLLIMILGNNAIPLERIELDSPGGDIDEGNVLDSNIYQVAELIRKQHITTVVPPGITCASACTLLFQSGVNRILSDSSQLIYHGVRIINSYYFYHYLSKCRKNVNSPQCQEFSDAWYKDCASATQAFFTTLERYGSSSTLFQDMAALPDVKDAIKDFNCFRKPDMHVGVKLAIGYRVATAIE